MFFEMFRVGMSKMTATSSAKTDRPSTEGGQVSLWERVSFTAAHASVSALLFILGLRGLYRFGRLLGAVEWLVNYKRRKRFARALRSLSCGATTGGRKPSAAREYFMRGRCDRIFYLIFDRIPREQARSLFTITNRQWIDEAISEGRGVYIALSHHGAHHITAMFLVLEGYKVAGVRDRREGGLRRFVQDRFDRLYPDLGRLRVLFTDSYPREIYRCFQDGYVLGSMMDIARVRDEHQQIGALTMFGEKRHFLPGPLRVAIRCRAAVIQGFIIPEPDFRYRLVLVEKLTEPDACSDDDEVLLAALRTYAGNIEKQIRGTPSLLTRI